MSRFLVVFLYFVKTPNQEGQDPKGRPERSHSYTASQFSSICSRISRILNSCIGFIFYLSWRGIFCLNFVPVDRLDCACMYVMLARACERVQCVCECSAHECSRPPSIAVRLVIDEFFKNEVRARFPRDARF